MGNKTCQAPQQPQQAFTQMPYAQDMGGTQPDQPKFVRAPFLSYSSVLFDQRNRWVSVTILLHRNRERCYQCRAVATHTV